MAVSLVGAGGLFTKLGHAYAQALDIGIVRGSALSSPDYSVTIPSKVSTLIADYAAGTAQKNIVDGIYSQLTAFQSAQTGYLNFLRTLAQNTLIDMVNTDTPRPNKSLSTALTELIRQMTSSGDDVNASTVAAGAQASVGTPNGNPTLIVSVIGGNGKTLEYSFAETLKFSVTGDSQGTATLSQEPMSVTGAAVQGDALHQDWPDGSGCSASLNLINASANNSGGNLLTNSDFEDFTTTHHPDNWTRLVGTIGTTILNGGTGYDGAGSLRYLGDAGGTLSSMYQVFDTAASTTADAGGTPAELLPKVPYAFHCKIKTSSTPAAGVLEFSLTDGSGTTINDDAGTANLFTQSLTSISTSWVSTSGVFRLPSLLPSAIRLKIRLSTAITDTKSVYIDGAALSGVTNSSGMTQLYTGGPFAAVFAGATKVLTGDAYTIAITNTWGRFQEMAERFFGMRALGLQLPSDSAAGETVLDSLVI